MGNLEYFGWGMAVGAMIISYSLMAAEQSYFMSSVIQLLGCILGLYGRATEEH